MADIAIFPTCCCEHTETWTTLADYKKNIANLNLTEGSFHLKSPKKSANLNGSDPDFDESAYIWSL